MARTCIALPSSGKYSLQQHPFSKTIVPARISESPAAKAKAMAVRIAEQLNLSGTLCVKCAQTADNIIVNEIARRPLQFRPLACDSSCLIHRALLGVLGSTIASYPPNAPAAAHCPRPACRGCRKYVARKPSPPLI